ncbi:hypothetical protein RSOLAG22IIIB_10518 [Rhizoctonia solani]|uniref:Tyrosinase copper-binding domain-containing protein n=1 Tax=Rhizoctonia solani TaxID=456999 RepID=A0A0K6G3H3_9AGAM|nr:hypothetical protein RSOLAG22IIIB_10518 [Rhizoctonia solani]
MRSFTVLLTLTATVIAAGVKKGTCMRPDLRVEWRTLTEAQKASYHKAVKCLQTKPSPEFKGRSQYDYFAWMYDTQIQHVHQAASFLPWHRYFTFAHTQFLKDCGYEGPTPYWDWTKDVNNMPKSQIFDITTGFGGDGEKQGHCVQGGPYSATSKFQLTWPWNQCLQRRFNDMVSTPAKGFRAATGPAGRHSSTQVMKINKNRNFKTFAPALEDMHQAVIKEISPMMSSGFAPLDPLFFLHLNNIDRLWALWQEANEDRLKDYGSITPKSPGSTVTPTRPATMNDPILLAFKTFPGLRVRQLLDTQGSALCYKYMQ